MEIFPFEEKYKSEVIDLILSIQNGEANINLPIEEQPDLNCITKAYINKDGNFWLALENEQVIGSIGLMKVDKDWSVLKKFFVRQDYRSKKVGLALYERLLDFARSKGYRHVILDTPSVAVKSHSFYERAGFKKIQKSDLPITYIYPDRDSILYKLDIRPMNLV